MRRCNGILTHVSQPPPEGGGCETLLKHWVTPLGRTYGRVMLATLCPSAARGSRFVGLVKLGPLVGEAKPLGKSSRRQPRSQRYLPTYLPAVTWVPGKTFLHHPKNASHLEYFIGRRLPW